jgi:hypothetical protein
MKYLITITGQFEVEIPELTEDERQYISDFYETAVLPAGYEDAEYLGGTITYEEAE